METLERASREWHEGCQNIPSMDVRDWSEDKSEKTGRSYPVKVDGLTVFPVKLHRYLNAIWKQDGTRADSNKSKAKLFEPTDGLRLLLEQHDKGLVKHMTDRFVQHAQAISSHCAEVQGSMNSQIYLIRKYILAYQVCY